MACYSAIVNCGGTDPITVLYGVDTPAGTLAGTIVMLSGDGGETLPGSFSDYIPAYLSARYQVIEAEWGGTTGGQPWEYTNSGGGGNAASILAAACRPATFLNWVRNANSGVGGGIWAGRGGMCAHGNSGGAGALGYVLAWYNGGAGGAAAWGSGYLDKVVMENGPVFSDIKQGCEYQSSVNSQYTFICSGGDSEPGCGRWAAQDPPGYHLEYVDGDQNSVNFWSGNGTGQACGLNSGTTTYDATWYSMSIVNFPTTGQQPSFSYPSTAMSGWLCANVVNTNPMGNNSAPEGQLFFQQFASTSQTAALSVNGVYNCPHNEGVEDGNVYFNNTTYTGNAYEAIIYDMTVAAGNAACVARH